MEAIIIYTIPSIIVVGILVMLVFEWVTRIEHRKITDVLRDGHECEVTILNVNSIRPTLFDLANVKITAEIRRPNEKSTVFQFKYEATYHEWQKLYTSRFITIDVNPLNIKSVLLNDSQRARERRYFATSNQKSEQIITE